MRILYAEDEKQMSAAVTAVLKHSNYSVDAVYDGEEAVDWALSTDYDVIVLDIMMPKKDGIEVLKELRQDLAQLQYLQDLWNMIETDPKLDEFKKNLTKNRIMRGKKVIVFTESKETAEYLCENLKDIYGDSVIFFSGQSSQALKVEIEDSFNPKNESKDNDKYDLLITTDVLAEGINLHRANVLVNYDLPWNPTRIMQRVGQL